MRALVLSGGGAKGSYAAGVINYLVGDLNRQYSTLCGVSVGALNTSILSMFPIGQEKEANDAIQNLWNNIETSKVYKSWFLFGRLAGLWKSSLYNSQPLIDTVKSGLDINKVRASGKQIRVGAVSLNTGEYRLFSQDEGCFVDGVLASSAFPGMLKPIEIENELWSDGGIKEVTPLKSAIDLGASEIDVIMTTPDIYSKNTYNNPNTIDIILRSIDLMSDEIISNDIDKALMYNKLIEFGAAPDKRYIKINIIRPDHILIDNSLDFSNKKMKELINIGYEQAKKIIL